jgi:hypothetical protein
MLKQEGSSNEENNHDNYWSLFLYAMKSPVTIEKYQREIL